MDTTPNNQSTPKKHFSNNAIRLYEITYEDNKIENKPWYKSRNKAKKNLTASEFNVLDSIMNDKIKSDYSSDATAKKLNLNPRTIRRTVDNLIVKGYATRYQRNKRGNKIYYNYKFAAVPVFLEENKEIIEEILKRKNKKVQEEIENNEEQIPKQMDYVSKEDERLENFINYKIEANEKSKETVISKMIPEVQKNMMEREKLINNGKSTKEVDEKLNPFTLEQRAIKNCQYYDEIFKHEAKIKIDKLNESFYENNFFNQK